MAHGIMTAIYTIGHGRHPFDYFLGLLRRHRVEFVVDVRAFARSRWPQYNGLVLAELLHEKGIGYEHIPETGGKNKPKPEDLEWGLDRIVEIAAEHPTAIMCSESWPLSHPAVAEAAVIGVPDEAQGTAMVAFFVLTGGFPQRRKDAKAGTRAVASVPDRAETRPSGSVATSTNSIESELKALVAHDMGKPSPIQRSTSSPPIQKPATPK